MTKMIVRIGFTPSNQAVSDWRLAMGATRYPLRLLAPSLFHQLSHV